MHICTKDKDDSLCSVETSFENSDFDQLFGQALFQIKQDTWDTSLHRKVK